MDRWLRWTVALCVFAILFGGSLLVTGAAADAPAPKDSPVLFGVPPSLPGDEGMYKTALVVVKDGRGEYFDMNARYAFQRLDDRVMLDGQGRWAAAASFVAEWRSEPFRLPLRDILALPEMPSLEFPDCWPEGEVDWTDEEEVERWSEAMEECGEQWGEEGERYGEEMEQWADEAAMHEWQAALDVEFHEVDAAGWHVTHHDGARTVAASYREDTTFPVPVTSRNRPFSGSISTQDAEGRLTFTEPLALPGPCGWRSSLQDGPQDMWQPITVHGACPPDMDLGFATVRHEPGPIGMLVSGRDRIDGVDAVVFSMPEGPDRLRLWFTDAPYPTRILTRTDAVPPPVQAALGSGYEEPAFYVLHELVEFTPGQPATAPGAEALPPAPAVAPRAPDGPVGTLAHPWPLGQALADAMAVTASDCHAWQEWHTQHPDRVLQSARFTYATGQDAVTGKIVDEAWLVVASAGSDARAAVLHRHTEEMAVPGQPPVRVPQVECLDAPVPDLPRPGATMPSLEAAAAALAALTGTLATDYGFHDVCGATCATGEAWLAVGKSPTGPGFEGLYDILQLGPESGLRLHATNGDPYPEPRFGQPEWDPRAGRDPWGFAVASSGQWVMPQPATAATLAAGAAAAGGLFLLWPALKGLLGALPMFSRIRDEELLSHPVREQIASLVEAEPGIHFQEMVRRLGKGRGTTEHHLRKLVAAGLLVEKAERGFSCYFHRGKIDRNVMAAAPLLKSDGARHVLQAIAQQPGSPALDIATRLGMSTSTVNYHVKKLADAGLLSTQRDGRFVRLSLTGIGDQALGQFVGT